MRILLVEDDAQLGRAVQTGLEQQGHAVDWIRDGVAGEAAALGGEYAAVLLDIGLPHKDGMQVLASLRRKGYAQPVLMLTARDRIPDRVLGLDAGADDFVVKPFDLDELGARLRAAARRAAGRAQGDIVHADLRIDPAARLVSQRGQVVALTAREYTLLMRLLEHRGRVQSRAQLQEALYSWSDEVGSNTVEVHIHHLRRKLGRELIRTVHGHGYLIAEPGDAA
jgi:two-component system OmpR family response regulator/two-component system response regulator QseB